MSATIDQATTLSRTLASQARRLGDAPWLEEVGGETESFAGIDRRASAIASVLRAKGKGPGERVLVIAANSIDFVAVLFGIARAGAIAVPVNTALSGAMLAHVCRDADASLLIADSDGLERFAAVRAQVPAVSEALRIGAGAAVGSGDLPVCELRHCETGGSPESDADARSIAAILYTSGTTGPAKGVLLPHAHLYLNALLYIDRIRLTARDVVYCTLPMFHLNAMTLQLYASLIVGCRLVFRSHFSASAWLADVREHGATVTNLLGSMTEFIFAQPATGADGQNRLRHVVAVPTPARIADRFEERFGVRLVELYGMTEITCPLYAPIDEPRRPGSCGRLVEEWFEGRIVDPQTDLECPDGTVGEFVIRPKHPFAFMAGYFRRTEETVKAWRNLWFHTGDAMRRDSDGNYYYVDRMKDCVRRRGENISTFEVEQVLIGHAGVREVAVIGIASPFNEGEQEIKALVVAADTTFDCEALYDYARQNLPHFALPRIIEVVGELPKTSTGKVSKTALRQTGMTPDCWVAADINQARRRA